MHGDNSPLTHSTIKCCTLLVLPSSSSPPCHSWISVLMIQWCNLSRVNQIVENIKFAIMPEIGHSKKATSVLCWIKFSNGKKDENSTLTLSFTREDCKKILLCNLCTLNLRSNIPGIQQSLSLSFSRPRTDVSTTVAQI
ncbi:hypothetical protein OPV22_017751 [Ensete ventricosum]|uniref:Uncharacterized protein n=1 Tax=Ensete ventricosum TaxID=4639 RepID=A0AAV8QTW4_ENSVE|nr:hypothetical protein OPV22_017751 [Ensete ventricosum]